MSTQRFFLLLLCLSMLLISPAAQAHSGHVSPIATFTQPVGPYEFAITLEFPPSVPSTMFLIVVPQGEADKVTLTIKGVPRGFPLREAATATVQTYAGTRVYYSELPVDRTGDWELFVEASGPRGTGQARIPFILNPPPASDQTLPLTITLASLAGLLVIGLGLSRVDPRRGGGWLHGATLVVRYAIFACVVVAATLGVQQYRSQANGAPVPSYGRPHVNLMLQTEPALPQTNLPVQLVLDFSDGSTGLPVDDIVPHHDALVHLLVVSDDAASFLHVHPSNTAPGRYAVDATFDRAGEYTVYAEIERYQSGTQVIVSRFSVAGPPAPAASDPPGLGSRQIDGFDITIQSSREPVQAGKQTTLTMQVLEQGQPVTTIEPWLGMAGHLIARSADRSMLGHIHASGAMLNATASTQIVTPPSYGPDIQFVYTFPQPGRYYLWAQFQINSRVITVPFVLEVLE